METINGKKVIFLSHFLFVTKKYSAYINDLILPKSLRRCVNVCFLRKKPEHRKLTPLICPSADRPAGQKKDLRWIQLGFTAQVCYTSQSYVCMNGCLTKTMFITNVFKHKHLKVRLLNTLIKCLNISSLVITQHSPSINKQDLQL